MSVNVSKVPPTAVATVSSLETRFTMRKLLIGAVIGVVAGAFVGGLAFAALATDSTATAFLRLQKPADLTAVVGGASQTTPENHDITTSFVAGEIAYLSGEGFGQAVARKMAEDEPAELAVAQVNESSVVTVSVSSRSADHAVRTVQTAIDLYERELDRRADDQLRTILPALSAWERRDPANFVRIQELQRLRESVELQAAQASTVVVVQPPTPNHPSSQQWLIGVFLGALVGGAGAVALLLARRRRAGRGALVPTLSDSVDGVLLPAVDLGLPPRQDWGEDQMRLGRTLLAQCPSPGPSRTVVVAGASSASGSSVVAALLKNATAEGPATTRVIDAGAVGEPTLLSPDLLAGATDIVLVARIEADTAVAASALRSATAANAVPTAAVFTYRRPRANGLGRLRSGGAHTKPGPR